MPKIKEIKASKILDSRAQWTIETKVILDDGTVGEASVPSGLPVGKYEAKILPPDQAIEKIREVIAPVLKDHDPSNQKAVDKLMIELDGSEDKSHLGANTLVSISMAAACAAAKSTKQPLYQYIAQLAQEDPKIELLPTPLLVLLEGGMHADNDLDFQEFLLAPSTATIKRVGLENAARIYLRLKSLLKASDLDTDVGDEGAFAPTGLTAEDACRLLTRAVEDSKLQPGRDIFLGLDVAAAAFRSGSSYFLEGMGKTLDAPDLIKLYTKLVSDFPIIYLEDPFAEDDFGAWRQLKERIGEKVDIVGDDLTVTNPQRLKKALSENTITGIIIKPNQVGTLTETLEVVKVAKEQGLMITVSQRSGETEDTFITDLAVGVGARYLKAGAPARGERVGKYNRLLEIEEELK